MTTELIGLRPLSAVYIVSSFIGAIGGLFMAACMKHSRNYCNVRYRCAALDQSYAAEQSFSGNQTECRVECEERTKRSEPKEDMTMSTTLDAMLVQTPDVCGGRIRIEGTRITIHRIATLYKQGQSAEEIARTYPHLSLGQIYTALAYYHAKREIVESELAAANSQYDKLERRSLDVDDAS